ncbi:hypothetical protein CJJ23_03430 [Mycoplasmopsis agassizii]|uniref:Uncharacterized protein n=1 Tax=Mycoplasmopsis agassizii TaxID=33922 RepID=A0A269TK75_9BACT|nr:hypothetical protein [Mycoplasmopsis agassizii]PAK21165.1 hypothetical protein CJJ23_03430 [Mycoplasmopsis agassizii]
MKDKFTDDFFAEKIIIFDYGNNASARVIVDEEDFREKAGEIVNLNNLEVKGKDITLTYSYKNFRYYKSLQEHQHVENYGIVYSLNKKDFNINGDGYQVKKQLYNYSEPTPIEKRNLKINSALSQNLHLNTETSALKWFKTEDGPETKSYFTATHIKEKSEFETLLNSFIEGYKKDYQKDFSETVKKQLLEEYSEEFFKDNDLLLLVADKYQNQFQLFDEFIENSFYTSLDFNNANFKVYKSAVKVPDIVVPQTYDLVTYEKDITKFNNHNNFAYRGSTLFFKLPKKSISKLKFSTSVEILLFGFKKFD